MSSVRRAVWNVTNTVYTPTWRRSNILWALYIDGLIYTQMGNHYGLWGPFSAPLIEGVSMEQCPWMGWPIKCSHPAWCRWQRWWNWQREIQISKTSTVWPGLKHPFPASNIHTCQDYYWSISPTKSNVWNTPTAGKYGLLGKKLSPWRKHITLEL